MGIESLDPATIALVLAAGLFAGWVDAVVGGGGLVQLPAVLMIPGLTPVQALAVNKLGSSCGTAASALTYYRRTTSDIRTALPTAAVALCASFCGAIVATLIPASAFKPIILFALIAVLAFTVLKPGAGELTRMKHTGRKHTAIALAIGLVIGFYDGVLGPGTGSFLMISMITLLGYNFLLATAQTKIVNLATNIGALIFFAVSGNVIWAIGLLLGAANLVGGYLGARTAIARGNGFIRIMMICVVSALILKLGFDIFFA
ncbi:TSUP family transporter [Rothia aerolata]|uniref:Probable membrane transporter protein n=1 Tax=Rothia aerolata TaxID=1812262 RepID=A0A917IV41_9MICC|nr:TSUP family transporter [Rothia aerolata]GGH63487.1 UPF0721 transmembrane protein [Rothia aerolata]